MVAFYNDEISEAGINTMLQGFKDCGHYAEVIESEVDIQAIYVSNRKASKEELDGIISEYFSLT